MSHSADEPAEIRDAHAGGARSSTRSRLTALCIGALIVLGWLVRRSSPEWGRLSHLPLPPAQSVNAAERIPAEAGLEESEAQSALCAPFIDLVPSQDGTEVFAGIQALDSCETVCVEPGWDPGAWLDPGWQCCVTAPCWIVLPGLPPEEDVHTSIDVTWPPDSSRTVDIDRAYVPALPRTIHSGDGALQWTLVNTDTLPFTTYVTIVSHAAPPGPAPDDHQIIGNAYSVRAGGALLTMDRPASLHLTYLPSLLGDADPHTLGIFVWDAYHRQWADMGGQLLYDRQTLAVATSRFATYALMATPSWRDGFADESGLNPGQVHNVARIGSPENAAMVLAHAPGDGAATSRPIVPTAPFAHWDTLTYDHLADAPTTTLTVDILGADGSELLANVASGVDLSHLDPDQHPALRLRTTLSSTVPGQTPALNHWQLAWTPLSAPAQAHNQYLPLVLYFSPF